MLEALYCIPGSILHACAEVVDVDVDDEVVVDVGVWVVIESGIPGHLPHMIGHIMFISFANGFPSKHADTSPVHISPSGPLVHL